MTLSFPKEPTEQAKTPNTLAPSGIADSFRVIRNNPFSEWLIPPSCKEGYPKEVPGTEDRAGKQKLMSPMTASRCSFNTTDWVLPGKRTGNLSQLSSEDKWLLPKKAKEVSLNSPLQEEHNFPQTVMASQ